MSAPQEYIPGTCNIGPKEIKARRNSAIFSALIGFALIILLWALGTDKIWRLTLFIPATSVGVGFLQWYNHFCVNFGLRGVFNFGELGKTFTVEQKEYYQKDRAKAWRMISGGIAFGIIITALFYLLPA